MSSVTASNIKIDRTSTSACIEIFVPNVNTSLKKLATISTLAIVRYYPTSTGPKSKKHDYKFGL